jgi:dihydroorotate dehydrogenase
MTSKHPQQRRQQQGGDALENLLSQLKNEQARLADLHQRYVPLAVKIAPDLDSGQINQIAACLMQYKIDAVIATNTTLSRDGVAHLEHGAEQGGLSGAPLRASSTAVIRQLATALQGAVPIIGAGGILSGADAQEKIQAGAALVQIYSGMVYRGPGLIAECAKAVAA